MISQEPLNKIGLTIKTARQQKGLSQDELAHEARVSVAHLKNIEAGNRKELPEEAYLLGFINKILRALNFENPEALVERYKKEEGSYIVQSIVNSHEISDSKFGFRLTDFKVHHLYTILVLTLIILAWLTITNYSKNHTGLDQLQPTMIEADTPYSLSPKSPVNVMVNGIDLEMATGLLDNNPTAVNRTVTNGVGSKFINIEATSEVWYQLIGVAQKKILYEGNVGPKSNFDHFKFYDEEGFVLATADAGAFMVDTGNGPFRLGKSHETIKWYFPQTARRIYKAWGENVQASKPDPVVSLGLTSESISETLQSNLQEQELVEVAVTKKIIAPRPVPKLVNDELVVKQETKAETKKRKKQELKRKNKRDD